MKPWSVEECSAYAKQLRDKSRANTAEHAAQAIEYLLRLVQAEQAQPVAWISHSDSLLSWDKFYDHMEPLYTAPPQRKPLTEWQPIGTAPKTGKKVVLFYLNRNNLPRTVMARWLTDEQAAETDADGVGLEGGWYECIDNWDDYTEVAIHEGEPSHWMPLPEPPTDAAHGITGESA
jgi:hypothetical protein